MTNAELIAEARSLSHDILWSNVSGDWKRKMRHLLEEAIPILERTERESRGREVLVEMLRNELGEAVAREAVLREALQDLSDWQNGPPLPSYETGWQEVHDRAQELLATPSPAAERLLAQVKAAERLVQLTEMVAKADGWKDTDEMVLAVKAYRKQEGP